MSTHFFQIQSAFDKDKLSSESLLKLQTYFGASWILGCLSFGFIVILKPRGCQITKLYLCIFSLIICGFCCFLADFVQGVRDHLYRWLFLRKVQKSLPKLTFENLKSFISQTVLVKFQRFRIFTVKRRVLQILKGAK